ncbi:MAG: T9SS type A sorting domain-containing protein [Ignavibacteriaceae bacterium]
MKTTFTLLIFLTMLVLFSVQSNTLAASDTLIVYASGASLDQIINSDTTSSGLQAHSAYKLVSLDTTYIFLGPVSVKSNLTVLGVLGSNNRPPCIQPGVLSDGSIPDYLFVMNGIQTVGIFKNLYLTGLATNNTINQANVNGVGALIQISADNIKLHVDNVIFEDWPENAISYSGNMADIFVTNCKFRNMISATAWYSGEAVRNQENTATTDSLVMKYNTIFCINSYAAGPVTVTIVNYFEFSHNSVIYNFQNPFWIFNVTNAKVDNNLFYANWVGGETIPEYTGFWDQLWSIEIGSIIDLDTLDIAKAKVFDPADSASSNLRWLAEAKRIIEVKNNVYFTPKVVTDFQTAWDDTAHTDSIYTPGNTFMDVRTTGMFTDKTHWPGLVQSGNLNVDPGFGSSIDQVVNNNVGDGVGVIQYFKDIRTNNATTDIYGYQLQSMSGNNWIPAWPLPESVDMQYSNKSLKTGGTDGIAIGDPGWFTGGYTTGVTKKNNLPYTYSLSQNYPNPFNPSTVINYSLQKPSNVTMEIYNVLGQKVATLVNSYMQSGNYSVSFNANKLSSGIYFYRIAAGDFVSVKKMMLMK